MTHAARLESSPRLQRVHDLLADGREHSTLDIVNGAGVCAVNSIVTELRHGGAGIECRQIRSVGGQRVWLYRMTRPVPRAYAPGRRPGLLPLGRPGGIGGSSGVAGASAAGDAGEP